MAMKAACPRLNCPVLSTRVKPMTAMAQMPLKMSMDRVATLVVKTGIKRTRKTSSPMTTLGTTFL